MAQQPDLQNILRLGVGGPPHFVEFEQSLIGCLIYEIAALSKIEVDLRPEHFYEPLHGRLYQSLIDWRDEMPGDAVSIPMLAEWFRPDEAFAKIGGQKYLADLFDKAPPPDRTNFYARNIVLVAERRALMEVVQKAAFMLGSGHTPDEKKRVRIEDAIDLLHTGLMQIGRHSRMQATSGKDASEQTVAYVSDRESRNGVNCGLAPMHTILGPLLPGEMYLIPGRPGMGKSALLCSVALRVAAPSWWAAALDENPEGLRPPDPVGVLEINGEMSIDQIMRRHFADMGHALYGEEFPTFKEMRDKTITTAHLEMMKGVREQLTTMPVAMLKKPGLRLAQVRSLCWRQKEIFEEMGFPLGLVIIDHVGLLRGNKESNRRYEEQTEIAIELHQMADDMQVPILAAVQLNREVEHRDDKRPRVADLRDTGAWEENADAIVFPFRDAYYAQTEPEPDAKANKGMDYAAWNERRQSKKLELIPGKVREGTRAKTGVLWADVAWNAIRSIKPSLAKGGLL